MGINQSWKSTYAFNNFRKKTFELSRMYWTQQLSVDCLAEVLEKSDSQELTVKVVKSSFEQKMHFHTVEDTLSWIPSFMNRNRLHLLVMFTGFLESYLKEITFLDIVLKGHVENYNDPGKKIKLTKVGEAISSPILKRSTIPEMMEFAGEYFALDFGDRVKEWKKIYKIRCIAAHNGGIATPKFLKDFGGARLSLNPQAYELIGLTWDELRRAMRYGDEIAAMIDCRIASYELRIVEADLVLREAKELKKLPEINRIW